MYLNRKILNRVEIFLFPGIIVQRYFLSRIRSFWVPSLKDIYNGSLNFQLKTSICRLNFQNLDDFVVVYLRSDLDRLFCRTYIRGQNVYMDPVTKKELEDKRQRQLEHQVLL